MVSSRPTQSTVAERVRAEFVTRTLFGRGQRRTQQIVDLMDLAMPAPNRVLAVAEVDDDVKIASDGEREEIATHCIGISLRSHNILIYDMMSFITQTTASKNHSIADRRGNRLPDAVQVPKTFPACSACEDCGVLMLAEKYKSRRSPIAGRLEWSLNASSAGHRECDRRCGLDNVTGMASPITITNRLTDAGNGSKSPHV